jgi:uncharacterized repeat protein (TIGR02543 family)
VAPRRYRDDSTEIQTVTFDWNGAPLDPIGPVQCLIGGEYDGEGFVGDAPLWAGHVFLGWWTDRVNGDRIRQGVEVSDQDSLEVFAHWGDEHVVRFNPNGGECDKESRICVQGATYYGLPKPTRTGYAFLGWFDDDDGGTLVQNGVTQVPNTAGRTLVAHWSGRQTVTFDANEGQCDVQSKTCIVGGKYYLPKATRDGYAFLGWFLGDTQYKSGVTVVTEDNEITLVAHWKERTAPLAISGFSFASKAARATRDVQNDSVECTLWVGTVAGFDYEIQWTPSLLGEWTVLKHWNAAADGETPVTVVIPSDASTGFIRLVELGVE